ARREPAPFAPGESSARPKDDGASQKPSPDLPRTRKKRRSRVKHIPKVRLVRSKTHRLRTFFLGTLVVVAAFLILGAVVIQIILHTSLPRNLVISRLQEEF